MALRFHEGSTRVPVGSASGMVRALKRAPHAGDIICATSCEMLRINSLSCPKRFGVVCCKPVVCWLRFGSSQGVARPLWPFVGINTVGDPLNLGFVGQRSLDFGAVVFCLDAWSWEVIQGQGV